MEAVAEADADGADGVGDELAFDEEADGDGDAEGERLVLSVGVGVPDDGMDRSAEVALSVEGLDVGLVDASGTLARTSSGRAPSRDGLS